MPAPQHPAPLPALIPAVTLPAELTANVWRVVSRTSEGEAVEHDFNFHEAKSQAEVTAWATRKFKGVEVCAVFPKDFESAAWAVLYSYHSGLCAEVGRLDFDSAEADFHARTKALEAFPGNNIFTLYPITK